MIKLESMNYGVFIKYTEEGAVKKRGLAYNIL